jgi:NAD(P)H-dependent FMN reductase
VPTILLISGSLRAGSTNTAVLETARAVATDGIVTAIYDGLGRLPHFNPDDDVEPLPPEVQALRESIRAADAVLFSTPEYAGALPGSFKNLLDWSIGGGEIYEQPVAWINVSAGGSEARNAFDSLRKVLGYAGTKLVEDACRHIPVQRSDVGADGLIAAPAIRDEIRDVVTRLAAAARS